MTKLLVELDANHAGVRITCQHCDEGRPHDNDYGFYSHGHLEGNYRGYLSLVWPDSCKVVSEDGTYLTISNEKKQEYNHILKKFVREFDITEEQASAALQKVNQIDNDCNEGKISYTVLFNNCVTFVQSIYEASGLKGHFANFYAEEQLLSFEDSYYPRANLVAYLHSRGNNLSNLYKFLSNFPLKNAFYHEVLHTSLTNNDNTYDNEINLLAKLTKESDIDYVTNKQINELGACYSNQSNEFDYS
jgi:hypothetical protein